MVFPGRLSTGCTLCRARKVKCDEAKPACRRCMKYGKACPGYGDAFQFRSENERRSRSAKKFPTSRQESSCVEHRRFETTTQTYSTASPQPDPEHLSLCYFMTSFVYECAEDIFGGHLDWMPQLYNRGTSGTYDSAVMSLSSMAAYKKWGSPSFLLKPRQQYGIALQGLQASLYREELARSDETLATTLLLAIFKEMSESGIEINPHVLGAYQLLVFRGPGQNASELSSALMSHTITQLCIDYMLSRDSRYSDLDQLAYLYEGDDRLDHRARVLAIRQVVVCCKIRRLVVNLQDFLGRMQPLTDSIVHLITALHDEMLAAATLFQDIDDWHTSAKAYLHDLKQRHAASSRLLQGTQTSIALAISSRITFCWEVKRAYEVLDRIAALHGNDTGSMLTPTISAEKIHHQIEEAIEDVLEYMPQAMNGLECESRYNKYEHTQGAGALAHLIYWPINAIVQCPGTSAGQRSYGLKVLEEIGSLSCMHSGPDGIQLSLFG